MIGLSWYVVDFIPSFRYPTGRGWRRTPSPTVSSECRCSDQRLCFSLTAISGMTPKSSMLLLSPPTMHGSFTRRPRRLAAACISDELPLGLLTVLAGATASSIVPVPTETMAHPHGVLRLLRPIYTQPH